MTTAQHLIKMRQRAFEKEPCQFCQKPIARKELKRHERTCYLNPQIRKDCPICGKIIKVPRKDTTCSAKCRANHPEFTATRVRSRRTNSKKPLHYKVICFEAHGRKCLVCEETKIVAVHHMNEDHYDDRPENLVPLCPTHHQYMHSRYKEEILHIVESYLEEYNKRS